MKTKTITNQTNNLFIIVFLLLSSLIFGQTTYVVDANFEAYLETHDANGNVVAVGDPTSMGNGIANDGFVTTSKISGVTNLDISGLSISNLNNFQGSVSDAINDFSSLKVLNCSNNNITSLYLNIPTLEQLYCNNNSIKKLIVSECVNLKNLNCSNNNLTVLDLNSNSSLNLLFCSNNQLKNLIINNGNNSNIIGSSFQAINNPNLTCVQVDNASYSTSNWLNIDSQTSFSENCQYPLTYVPDNRFENWLIQNRYDIDLDDYILTASIETVDYIDIYNSNLSDFTGLEDCSSLTELNIYNNNLTSLDVSYNTLLTSISCYGNNITNINFGNTTSLNVLHCGYNNISSLDLSNMTSLNILNCDNNNLTSLNVKNGNNLNLQFFDARYNPNLTCIQVDDPTWSLTNWSAVDPIATFSEDCSTTYVPDNNFETYLETHDVNGNIVAVGSTFSMGNGISNDNYVLTNRVDAVTTLDISNKNISDLTGIGDFISLTSLDCQNNTLTTLNISNLTNLSVLRCNNNSLSVLDVSNQGVNLTRLYCNNNSLTALDVSNNSNLTRLYCNDNMISALNLNSNTLLTHLFLQNNNLVDLDLNTLTALVHLDVSNNNLESLKFTSSNYNNIITFDTRQNVNLTCIEVFNVLHSTTFWTNIDAQTSFSEDCHFSETYIPDIIFEAYLETHDENGNIVSSALSMGNGISGDHYVTTANINTVTDLDISSLTISDLTGIEDFIALTFLNCSDNLLTSLDISQNTALSVLNCDDNSLTSLNLTQNTALSGLQCIGNSITTLDLTQNTALTELYCYNNNLNTLDVSLNTVLNTLECNNNQLTELNVANGNNSNFSIFNAVTNPNLSCIQVDDATYSTINWTNIDATASFSTNCHYTETYVPDNNFETYLETHDANGNVVAVGNANSMGNGIANDDYVTTAKISGVTDLNVNTQSITDLTGIEDFVALIYLNCGHNFLTSLNVTQNTALINLSLHFNNVSSLNVSQNTVLTNLNCNGNNLSSLDISQNTLLGYLYCSFNNLSSLNISQNIALTNIECIGNILTSIDVTQHTNLEALYIPNNQLTFLDISQNTNLLFLDCKNNSLTGLSTFYNNNLRILTCNNNQINSLILPQQTGNLLDLNFSNNQISTLDVSAYTQLSILDCSSNVLTQLNVANGNNSNVTNFNATTNSNLTCIQIDNGFVPTTPTWQKDATASYSTNCHFNETYVPDNNFEAYLEANGMGNGIANDDYVTTSNINSVTTLTINNKNISDVTGIEDFIALTNLDCEYNQLTTVDFTSNTALVTLRCNNNQIVNLDLFPNAALQNLYCNDNAITNIQISPGSLVNLYCENNQISLLDLSNFFNLVNVHCFNNAITQLDLLNSAGNLIDFRCNNNQLTSIDIDANIDLTTFYCGNNQLTNLVLVTNTALEDLRCDNNQLTSLDINLNTNLRVLLCNNNNIPNIDIAQNTALTDLFCNNNQLTNLDLSQNTALVELRCQNNQLTDLVSPSAFLQFLNCDDNDITNLDVTQNTALIDLKCSENQLSDIDVSANAQLAAFNCSANSLTSLNLKNGNNSNMTNIAFDATGNANLTCIEVDNVAYSTTNWTNIDAQTSFSLNCNYGQTYVPDNNFEQALINLGYDIVLDDYVITSNISGLTILDVSLQNISDLTGIEDFIGLVDLNCSANNLTNLDVTNNTVLTKLGCGANSLTTLDVQQNVALTELVVTQNQLTGLDVTQNVNLLFLACEFNPFTSGLDITNNTLLQDLIVNNLNLTTLDISLNDDLQTIDCNNNSITTLDFTGKQDLEEVRCQNNNLTDLYLRENPALTYVDCSNNNLTDFTIDNGNNTTITGNSFYATNNINLTCIQVDNVAYSTTNWTNIDVTTGFSINCATFGLTNVPDNNFENYLETHDANGNVVALGSATSMGNGIANDDYVFTNRINTVTDLDINSLSIIDLTGIDGFITLTDLNCQFNDIVTLDLSQNTNLINLICDRNYSITSINITQCNALEFIFCSSNKLTSLDVSQNLALRSLLCDDNLITGLDTSNNIALTIIHADSNQLTSLNVKNGNNSNVTSFNATNNPNLTCIEVDNISIPSTPTWQKDVTASYNTNCSTTAKIWEFGQWTNGTPTIADNAIIRDFYITATGNIEAKTLTIDPTFSVVIFGGDYIKLQSDLINNGDLIIENQGSFVQVDNGALNLGSGYYETVIETTQLDDADRFTYFSSPSQTETLTVFNSWANTNAMWDFDIVTQNWNLLNGTEPMLPAKGFAIRPATSNTFPFNAITEFIGPFNNGIFTQALVFNPGGNDDDNNLVGNPYPSAIDASLLLNNNTGANAFYFWTHKSILGLTGYVSDDYAIWNNVGGVASASGSPAPTGFIASGQGFFVDATLTGNLVFDNYMRVTGNNNDFRTTNQDQENENDKIWINLSTDEGHFSQLLIAFIAQGSNGFDPTYDATRINSGAIVNFYTIGQNNEHFAIESRGVLNEERIIPIGLNLLENISANFTLSIDHFENLAGATVFVKDNLLNQLHDLKLADYQFSSNEIGVINNRFELIFNRTALGVNDDINTNNDLIVTNIDAKNILIKILDNSIIKQLEIYDTLGKTIVKLNPNNNDIILETTIKQGTVLFVKVKLENGQILTKKFLKL